MFKLEGYIDNLDDEKSTDLLIAITKAVEEFDSKLELFAVLKKYKEDENGEEKGTSIL